MREEISRDPTRFKGGFKQVREGFREALREETLGVFIRGLPKFCLGYANRI